MKLKTLILGAVSGAAVALGSMWIILKAVLHTRLQSGQAAEGVLVDLSQVILESLSYILLAFVVAASGLTLFVLCIAKIVILERMEDAEREKEGNPT